MTALASARTAFSEISRKSAFLPGSATLGLLLVSALFIPSCRRALPALAEVGDKPVTTEDLQAVVRAETGKSPEQVAPELVAALFESYLEEEVILASSTAPVDRRLPLASRGMRARELLAELCPPPPEPSESEIDARIAAQPPTNERLLLRQLILPDQAAARAARQRLQEGEDFAALSKELSRAPNAAEGGAIGWVERGQLVPEFEAVIFGLKDGGVSQPVASNTGWHVFQVTARKAPGSIADAAIRLRLRDELVAKAAERARRDCVLRLAQKVGVKVECSGATFPCRNPFQELP